MSIIEYNRINNPHYERWLEKVISISKLIEDNGELYVHWDDLDVERCKMLEKLAVELEMYNAAAVYRDNIHKCFDAIDT